ncbi:hypothetical protein [Terrabacter terrae]|uniref:hypothetical protein n=1 Tax=Terrabacter terrae TaxID=318434 RepID=UPI0031DD4ECA
MDSRAAWQPSGTASGWGLGLLAVVAGEQVGTLTMAVPVPTLVGGAVRSSRLTVIGAYAAAAVVARVLVGRWSSSRSGPRRRRAAPDARHLSGGP